MSHTAAAFILKKSNEVLTMIKAFKRKTNNNDSIAAATSNGASNSSLSQSKRISAVNCMNLSVNVETMSFCDNNDASNIYTEIDLRDVSSTKRFETGSNLNSSSNSLSFDILHFLFNDISSESFATGDHNQSEMNQSNSYVNETATSQAISQVEMNVTNDEVATNQNLYEINSDVQNSEGKTTCRQQTGRMTECATVSDPSVKSNAFFVNIGNSLRFKHKPTMTEEAIELKKSLSNVSVAASENDLTKDDIDKASFRKRIKIKFKTGLQFFKDAKVCC